MFWHPRLWMEAGRRSSPAYARIQAHARAQISLSSLSSVQLTLWFVYIAFNYLSVSLVELNKILYCGYYSLGAHPLFLWPFSFRQSNFRVNKSHFEASAYELASVSSYLPPKNSEKAKAKRLLASLVQSQMSSSFPLASAAMCMCLCLSELCNRTPSAVVLMYDSNLSPPAARLHLSSSLQQIIIFIEKPAMVLAGKANPQLRLQRNDHCKSHSVSLSCKLSHGCHGGHDVIVKAILFLWRSITALIQSRSNSWERKASSGKKIQQKKTLHYIIAVCKSGKV